MRTSFLDLQLFLLSGLTKSCDGRFARDHIHPDIEGFDIGPLGLLLGQEIVQVGRLFGFPFIIRHGDGLLAEQLNDMESILWWKRVRCSRQHDRAKAAFSNSSTI